MEMASRTYKAKRKNWRELPREKWWIEGSVFEGKENSYIITNVKVTDEWEDSEIGADVIGYLVDPETICQDTGLTDKNGRKIFEGDCLGHKQNVVEYLSGSFVVSGDRLLSMMAKYNEVVGNIFDKE